jgi:O-antigen/teichoic acid export membrane protein
LGIIEKQATRNAIYSYLGAGLGFLTVMWMSHLFVPAENGVLRVLVSYAALFAQFANLGFTSVTSRFFPYFRNKDKGHHGFLFYALIVTAIGFLICYVVFILLQPTLIARNQEKSQLFVTYLFYLMPLTLFTVFFNIFDSYLRSTYNSVIGSFSKEFLQRLLILLLLLAYFMKMFDFTVFILLYISVTCLPTLILLLFIMQQGEWHIKPVRGFLSKELRTEMIRLGIYSILAGGAGAIVLNIDAIMINSMLGENYAGIYGIAFYFGTIILIPARSLYRIMSGIVAEAFKNDDLREIGALYRKSCNSQMTIGLLLYIGIVANIGNIMTLLPPAYAEGKNVILVLSLGYLVEMATGINQVIIANSKYYRFDAFFVFLMVGLVVGANLIFIPLYGITGSAIATAVTVSANNLLRFLFLKIKYGMQPYDFNSLKLLLIAAISLAPGIFLPYIHDKYSDIALRSAIVGGLFLLLTLKTEAAPELNVKIRKNLKHFGITFL